MFCIILISKALSGTSCSFVLSHITRYAPLRLPRYRERTISHKKLHPDRALWIFKGVF